MHSARYGTPRKNTGSFLSKKKKYKGTDQTVCYDKIKGRRSVRSFNFMASLHKKSLPGVRARKNAIEELGDALIWPKRACAAEQGTVFKVSLES